MKTIICLSGKRHSGKSTVENMIKLCFQKPIVSYQMATKLKKVVSALTNCRIEDLEKAKFKQSEVPLSSFCIQTTDNIKGFTYRELLIEVGRVLRSYNNDIFINDVTKFIENTFVENIIIPDVREKHELEELIKCADMNGYTLYTIRIERPGFEVNDNISKDRTECDLDDYHGFDMVITNDSDIKALNHKVNKFLLRRGIIENSYSEQLLF